MCLVLSVKKDVVIYTIYSSNKPLGTRYSNCHVKVKTML